MKVDSAGELTVARFAPIWSGDYFPARLQFARPGAKLLCGLGQQEFPHLGCRVADGCAAVLHRLAASGKSFIRRSASVSRHQCDVGRLDVQFFRRYLDERGLDSLPKLGLPGEDHDLSFRVDANPTVEETFVIQAAGEFWPRRGLGGLLCPRGQYGERDDQGSARFEN